MGGIVEFPSATPSHFTTNLGLPDKRGVRPSHGLGRKTKFPHEVFLIRVDSCLFVVTPEGNALWPSPG
jgi:hypothetical protein